MSEFLNQPFICPLQTLGTLAIRGIDAKKLLQGQLTCDMEKIMAGQSSLAAHCNPQGRVIALFYIFHHEDVFYCILPHAMVPILETALKKYAIFYKVTLASQNHWQYWGISETISWPNVQTIPIAPQHTRAILAINKPSDIPQEFPQKNEDEWQYLNIEDKIPMIFPETSGLFLPHDIDLPRLGAIDFAKGCYTGQEIIARMQYKGKLKTHLYLAEINTPDNTHFIPGMPLFSASEPTQQCGTIIDAGHKKGYNSDKLLIVTTEQHVKDNHIIVNKNLPSLTFVTSNE